jgi:hypothetical protein
VTFNWTAVDSGTVIICNLTIDGIVNVSNITGTTDVPFTQLVPNIPEGSHSWNVTCRDDLGQYNTSETYNFSVNAADIVINDTNLVAFNNSNPNENDTINISANISNIGGVPATNANISFWDGTPGVGLLIGSTLVTLQPNESRNVSILWNITLGFHQIYVVADFTNVISEQSEANNNASKNISLLRVLINTPSNATITRNTTPSVNFTIQNFTGGNFTYTIYIDGVLSGQNGTVIDNQSFNLTLLPLSEGVRRVIVQANDSLRYKNSTPLTIIIDLTPPNGTFTTRNGTFFTQPPLNVTVRINDTFDLDINYTIFINDLVNAT